ncbi:Lipid A export ATP-binding/permease protein MsbA [Roseibium album]|nr:Lipid A export ATP-binding/permease protein MsbA [Roseibium album]
MRAVWDTICSQHQQDRVAFWIGLLVAILPAAAGILLLGVSGWFITAAAIAGLSGAFLNIFAPSAIIRALAIIRTGGRYGERVLTHDATFKFLTGLRNRLFSTFVARDASGTRSGILLNRLTQDIDALDTIYLRLVVPIFLSLACAFGLVLFWVSISTGIFITGVVLLSAYAVLASVALVRSEKKTARLADAASEAMRMRAAELAASRRDLAIYGGLEGATQTVLSANERLARYEEVEQLRSTRLTSASSFLGQVFLAAFLVVCVWSVVEGVVTPTLAVGLVLVVMALPELFGQMLPGLSKLPRIALAASRTTRQPVDNLVLPAGQAPNGAAVDEKVDHVLRFKNVSYRYPGADREVLDSVSLEVNKGEVVAVAGRSGSGKSTLAALASRLRVPDTGDVLLNGCNLQGFDEVDLRKSVTVIGQKPHLFNDTIAVNLRIAKAGVTEEELWEALERAALSDRIAESSRGLNTVLGEGGLGLSGGEQRRLALARAFLTRPDLFILDEMTEGLDTAIAQDVLTRFLEFKGQASVLMIAHKDLELRSADRIIHI